MREIKFRGQTRRKGEQIINMAGDKCDSNWVYGGIFPQNEDEKGFAIIYQQEPEIKKYPVYADTVGQYTGLRDKNGSEIYEGDILHLNITKELLQTTFRNSNLGKFVLKNKLTDVFLKLEPSDRFLSIIYNIYFKQGNSFLIDEDGEIEYQHGTDYLFPCYFIEKGGVLAGNVYDNADLIKQ